LLTICPSFNASITQNASLKNKKSEPQLTYSRPSILSMSKSASLTSCHHTHDEPLARYAPVLIIIALMMSTIKEQVRFLIFCIKLKDAEF